MSKTKSACTFSHPPMSEKLLDNQDLKPYEMKEVSIKRNCVGDCKIILLVLLNDLITQRVSKLTF